MYSNCKGAGSRSSSSSEELSACDIRLTNNLSLLIHNTILYISIALTIHTQDPTASLLSAACHNYELLSIIVCMWHASFG